MKARLALVLAAALLFAAVALGAFGAHALKTKLAPDQMAVYQTAVQYHFWHALGLLAVGILLLHKPESGALMAAAWLLVGRGIRGYSHLRRHPAEIFLLPLYALIVIMVALPIKAYAIVTMNKQGWLTRHADRIGGEGQDEASLTTGDARAGA